MDKAYVAILSVAFLFLLHYLVGRAAGGGKGKRLPPSPLAIPFIGHLHLVKTPFHSTLTRLAANHGPVFSMRMGHRRAVVVSSPECAKVCFTEHDQSFANRPHFPSMRLVSFDGAMLSVSAASPPCSSSPRTASPACPRSSLPRCAPWCAG
jgi:hypothetical protein